MTRVQWEKLCFSGIIAIVIGLFIGYLVSPLLFNMFNPFAERSDAMSEREMRRCFRRNYDDLSIVATYFENSESNHFIEIIYQNGEVKLHSEWEDYQIEIDESEVMDAIRRLKRQGYTLIWSHQGEIMFVRDITVVTPEQAGVLAHGGTRRTGVYYLFGNDIDRTWSIPISSRHPNWYFFSWMGY